MREGALALGATRGRATLTVVLPAALPGIITGVVLALARIAGETAPLLFTAFNNRFLSADPTQPIASLTVQVYTYAISPYEDWHRQAWAGALVLVTLVLICSLLARDWRPGASSACRPGTDSEDVPVNGSAMRDRHRRRHDSRAPRRRSGR